MSETDLGTRATRTSSSRGAVPTVAAGALLGLLLAACAATGSSPVVEPADPVAAAEAATRDGLWATAAHRWHEIHLAQGGRDPRACVETARALLHLDDARGAQALCQQGLRLHPTHPELLEMEGEALCRLGYRRAAEARFEEALQSEPERVSALVALGRLRMELGLERAAVAPLERAVDLDPDDLDAWMLLGRAAQATGDGLRAFQVYRTAFETPDIEGELLVAAARLWSDPAVRQRYPAAGDVCRGWLERAIARNPQDLRAHFQLGVLREHEGDLDGAVAAYRRAVELEPTCVEAITNLAVIHAQRGEEGPTREMVERALALENDPGRRRALVRLLDGFGGRVGPGADAERGPAARPTAGGSGR